MAKEIGRLEIPINEIRIGERVRKDMGDIELLALNITLRGLLMPIIVHKVEEHKYELVDGARRIAAFISIGKKTIDARLMDTLEEEEQRQLETELSLRRKTLTFQEEAKAVERLVALRKRQSLVGTVGRFSGAVKNKDIAMELGMSESCLSQNLKIAQALYDHPELEQCENKTEVLRKVQRGEYAVVTNGAAMQLFMESYTVDAPLDLINSMPEKGVTCTVMHPDRVDKEALDLVFKKTKIGGSVLVFTDMAKLGAWEEAFDTTGFILRTVPYMWVIKDESNYMPILWAGRSRDTPLRIMPNTMSYGRGKLALSLKAKPYNLISTLLRANTEQGDLILCPWCEDIETLRFCVEHRRNIRAATLDKILHDRLIMTANKKGS